MNTTHQILQEYNKIIDHISEEHNEKFQQIIFNKILLIKEEIKEIVLAVQLAKAGVVNTNLLDRREVNQILAEIETLPYSNDIEAIEYATPAVMVKNSTLLYVISLPKTGREEYNHLLIRSITKNSRKIFLEYKEILMNQGGQFGITDKCRTLKDTTICRTNQLRKLSEDHCINRIIRGHNASCEYQHDDEAEIEALDDDTIFLNNFKGDINHGNVSKHLEGSFLIQYNNETILINGRTFTNKELKTVQILPPILQTNITEKGIKLDLRYLHKLHLNNIEKMRKIAATQQVTHGATYGAAALIILGIVIFFLRKAMRGHKEVIVFPEIISHQTGTVNA